MLNIKTLLGKILKRLDMIDDYVISRGKSGAWTYRKYASGRVLCEGYYTFASLTFTQRGQCYRSGAMAFTIPSGIFSTTPTECQAWIQSGSATDYMTAVVGGLSTTGGTCQLWKATSGNATNISAHMRIIYMGG